MGRRNIPAYGAQSRKDKLIGQHYIKFVVPHVLASFALALDEDGMKVDKINDILVRVQEIWEQSTREGWDVREYCSDKLDIDVVHYLEAKERGLLSSGGGEE